MKRNILTKITGLAALLLLLGCNKEKPLLPDDSARDFAQTSTQQTRELKEGAPLILGEQLENPYTPENMQKAKQELESRKVYSKNRCEVRMTHQYIRFKPASLDEYDVLKNDSTLTLYEYPLDFAIVQRGSSYRDPAVADDQPTYQYSSVPFGKEIDQYGVPYEVLSELYIPEEDRQLLGADNGNLDYVDKLLDQAYIQTKNFEDTVKIAKRGEGPSFTPGGQILIFDSRLNTNIGLQGVEMRANRWFTTHYATTNFNGNYRMGSSFSRPCNYSLYYQTGFFDIRSGSIGQAWLNGPKLSGDWNTTLQNQTLDNFYGTVFRGAFIYNHGNSIGLNNPFFMNGFYKIKYAAMNSNGDANGMQIPNFAPGIFNDIKIWRYVNNNLRSSDGYLGTTIHETGHLCHAKRMNAMIQWWQVTTKVAEGWARAVQVLMTRVEYQSRGIANYGMLGYIGSFSPYNEAFQNWSATSSSTDDVKNYSPLFLDFTDNINQLTVFGGARPNDNVTNYTLPGIENGFLKHAYGLSSLTNELKANKPAGVTDAQIDAYMAFHFAL